jgi:glycosyltransferase involved in cell wall biosynthesis
MHLAAAQRALRKSRQFDVYAAGALPAAEHLIAFNGTALAQIRAARRTGGMSTALVSATSHFRLLARQHALAHRQYPLEESWATRLLERNLSEYSEVDRIYVSSDYTRDSFIAEGVGEELLTRLVLTPDPRFEPGRSDAASSTFDIVFCGSLSVVKGVPLLIDAVRALPYADLRLVLVGGWKSRGMRRFVQRACAQDPRIWAGHGDPLPRLRGARLCVHPTYNDGFGYAPAEALACGVPVIVTEDTGMKDLIEPGRNGAIVPTGDLGALTQAVEVAYRGELCSG